MVAKYASIRHPINLAILAPVLVAEVDTTRDPAPAIKAINKEATVGVDDSIY